MRRRSLVPDSLTPSPPRPNSGSGAKKAALIAAAVLVIVPVTASQEGLVTKARPDPAHIPTYCYGETENVDPQRIYTKTECMVLLRKRLARDYAPKVLACVPQLQDARRKYVFASLIDASYNAGPVAVCKSPMAIRIRAADWEGGCHAFVGWYTTARDRKTGVRKPLPGLVKRRRDVEAPLCLKGAVLQPLAAPQPVAPPVVPQPVAPPAPSLTERIGAFFHRLFGGQP